MTTLKKFFSVIRILPSLYLEELQVQRKIEKKGLKKFIEEEEEAERQIASGQLVIR